MRRLTVKDRSNEKELQQFDENRAKQFIYNQIQNLNQTINAGTK